MHVNLHVSAGNTLRSLFSEERGVTDRIANSDVDLDSKVVWQIIFLKDYAS